MAMDSDELESQLRKTQMSFGKSNKFNSTTKRNKRDGNQTLNTATAFSPINKTPIKEDHDDHDDHDEQDIEEKIRDGNESCSEFGPMTNFNAKSPSLDDSKS